METRDRSQVTFYAVAGVLMVLGIGFLVAAVISFQDDGDSGVASRGLPPETTPSPTPFEQVQSARDEGDGVPGTTPTPTGPAATATPRPTSTPVPPEDPVQEPIVEQPPTATPEPQLEPTDPLEPEPADPTEEPTEPGEEEEGTPTPVPTPSPGPVIAGPAALAVGETAPLTAGYTGGEVPLTYSWEWAGGSVNHQSAISVSFAAEGCYAVTLTAIYESGPEMVQHFIAVGETTC